jgi:hypothetical protein
MIQMPQFQMAPIRPLSPKRDALDLVIRLLAWLLSLAIAAREGGAQSACCDNPKVKDMGAGWRWCTSCGSRWKETPSSRERLYSELDYSLKVGHNLDWLALSLPNGMKRES